ncbi:hypothetical protein B188_22420 [Candidatus Brocadiaceae bacterium B188]|nr:transporter [Candidatus Brocadia sapporoensis]QQR67229.1 MAG: transporter [Candidatus Brocadia sp.]RZV56699.1 MAG: transporter [Candidatus Brocadia sp. BROELEC01]TWU54246.1 hypothetical protein B188_22420 [Candidatus Brocadiaceae bacterium B188]
MRTRYLRSKYLFSLLILFLLVFIKSSEANHGAGTSGTAITIPAITLKSGVFSLGLRTEFTEFEGISDSKLLEKAVKGGSFDAVDRTLLSTMDVGYGVTDDLTVGLTTGWFESANFRESELEDDEVNIFHANPDGLTDLWLSCKYRFMRGPQGHYAVLAGVKFPTGVDDKKNNAGEKLEAVEQPGSGSYDFTTAFAYSRWFTRDWTMDTSIQYIYRTEGSGDFKVGDRIDWSLATTYQVIPKNRYPNVAPVGEINTRYLFRDKQDGKNEHNSGGTIVFLSPGVRAGITPHLGFGASILFPVFQNLLGEQQETDFKVVAGVSYSF